MHLRHGGACHEPFCEGSLGPQVLIASESMSLLQTIYVRLFTKEDHYNFHKTLGITCLLSYLYRFAHVGPSDMRFSASSHTRDRSE